MESTQIWVRLKKDTTRVRQMTRRSFEVNKDKWELDPDHKESDETLEQSKKKVVEAAAEGNPDISGVYPHFPDHIHIDDEKDTIIDTELETLRSDYELKARKPADKRWKADRIKAEIEKFVITE
jgi:hypothetical protein